MNRRTFLSKSTSCSAHVLSLAYFAPHLVRTAMAAPRKSNVVVEEKWGRLEEIAEGVWALISTPFTTKDFTTVCNAGIVAGDKGLLAIESFMSARGATWFAEQAKQLAGKWPTDIVSTHYHADHTGGHLGYFQAGERPRMWLTEATKDAAEASFVERGVDDNEFQNVSTIDAENKTIIDLGNRQVKLMPRSGHTSSDVTIELVDPKVIWCGDLFFNRFFPNFSDATPTRLNQYAEELLLAGDIAYVPGHGPLADLDAVKKYQEFLALVEESATKALQAGKSVEEGASEFNLPEQFSDWIVWSPDNAKRAYTAWYRELEEDT